MFVTIMVTLSYPVTLNMNVDKEYTSWHNWAIMSFWAAFSIIVSYRLCAVSEKDTSLISNGKTLFFYILFGILFHSVHLLIITSGGFIKVWHTYYIVRAIESIAHYGSVSSLNNIHSFDNFLSSPGAPITGSILLLITELNSENITAYFGLSTLIVSVLGAYLIIKRLFFDKIPYFLAIYVTLVTMSVINFLYATFNYIIINVSLITLAVFMLIVLSIKNLQSIIFLQIIFVISSAIYYLPGTLLIFLFVFISVLLIRIFNKEKLTSSGIFSALIFSSTFLLAYFLYVGFAFFDDFVQYLSVILQNLRVTPFIVYSEPRIEMLDPVMRILVYTAKLSVLRLFVFLIGSIFCIKLIKKHFWFVTSGMILALLSATYIFIHAITDYTLRFNTYLIVFGPVFTIGFLKSFRKTINGKIFDQMQHHTIQQKLLTIIFGFILFTLLFGNISSWLFSQILMPTSPKTAFDIYYMKETYDLSKFIGTYVDQNSIVIGNYRYGYVKSIFDLNFIELNDYFINSINQNRNWDWILVLSILSKNAPDRYSSMLSNHTYEFLNGYYAKIYDSAYSLVYK